MANFLHGFLFLGGIGKEDLSHQVIAILDTLSNIFAMEIGGKARRLLAFKVNLEPILSLLFFFSR